ncbi:hypothetical protein BBOMB_1480 [Bifidobacterium bombi DSM 19703]|uniref:Uncharacterized protein n=1 Tax=Bifidobacterium bombi DSM 19703 TaxID=1341695 RepID=A0A086BNV3_9BIFI|nr:hypothetical protein BBOMB_1480 [Bifidobacterium bombi DSM 19703]
MYAFLLAFLQFFKRCSSTNGKTGSHHLKSSHQSVRTRYTRSITWNAEFTFVQRSLGEYLFLFESFISYDEIN